MTQKNKGGNTITRVWDLAQPIAQELGLEIWDICFLKEGSEWYLRIFIDKEDGITIDDCERMSKAIDGPLDELDPIDKAYFLEVSSPGLERELKRDTHFEKCNGMEIYIKLIRPDENGKREYIGNLQGFDNGIITIQTQGEKLDINIKNTNKVQLNDFGGFEENE